MKLAMDVSYNGFIIRAGSQQLPNGRYAPSLTVSRVGVPAAEELRIAIPSPSDFDSAAAAESHAIASAKDWIDAHARPSGEAANVPGHGR